MIVQEHIRKDDLAEPFVKAAVDLQRKSISIACEFHMDCQEELVQDGSRPGDVWGINLYPDGRLEYVSLINIRPKAGNRSMEIGDPQIRVRILAIVRNAFPEAHD